MYWLWLDFRSQVGDAANEVPRGVPFEKLPAKFICGVCGCTKDKFVKIEEQPPKKKK
jgi:rubredoxin